MLNAAALEIPSDTQVAEAKTSWPIKLLVIAIIITIPYQQTYLPIPVGSGGGYIVDLFLLLLILVGWGEILWNRRKLRFPFLLPMAIILIGSLLGTLMGLNRTEALSVILRDLYIWLIFFTVVNVVRERKFLDTLIRVWVVVALLECALIMYALVVTSDQKLRRVGFEDSQALHELGAPSEAELSSSYRQAKHQVKRVQLRSYGAFVPGLGIGTFANVDFTGLYLSQSVFVALAMTLKRARWLRYVAAGIIAYGAMLTKTSAPMGAIPAGLAVYLFFTSSQRLRFFLVAAGVLVVSAVVLLYVGTSYVWGMDPFALIEGAESDVVSKTVGGIGSGAEDRAMLLAGGWAEFRERPLGLGAHGMRASGVEKNVHNEYAAYLFERGLMGLGGLLLFRAMQVGQAVVAMQGCDRKYRMILAGLLAAIVVQIVFDLAHEVMRQRDVWMVNGMLFIYADMELQRRRAARQADRARRFPWAYPRSEGASVPI